MKQQTHGTIVPFSPKTIEGKLQARIVHALNHPDCPVLIMPYEQMQLAKHIAFRITDRWKRGNEDDDQ